MALKIPNCNETEKMLQRKKNIWVENKNHLWKNAPNRQKKIAQSDGEQTQQQ